MFTYKATQWVPISGYSSRFILSIILDLLYLLYLFYLGLIQFNNSTKAKANKLIDKLYLLKRIIHKTTDGNYATVKYSKRYSFTHLQINLWSNVSKICKYPFLPLFILKLNAFFKTTLRDNKKELLKNYPKPIKEHNFQLLSLLQQVTKSKPKHCVKAPMTFLIICKTIVQINSNQQTKTNTYFTYFFQ